MVNRRKSYTASRSRRTSRQVNERMVGTHIERGVPARTSRPGRASHSSAHALAMARRARMRRLATAVVAIAVVLAVAVGVGFLVFRGTVGGELQLKNSDAAEALVPARTGEPTYVLVTAELGAVAAPLENEGPDVILLARLDPQARSLALVNVPSGLQITYDNRSESAASVAQAGDAALINAIATFSKVDISHIVKFDEAGVAGMVDALGGVEVDVEQAVDDPHAGTRYLPQGTQVLDGEQALTFLRATNLEYGMEDQLVNQLKLATRIVGKLFSGEGRFATRIESVDSYFQTDFSLSDLEGIDSWLAGVDPNAITCAVVPGYFTVVTNVTGDEGKRYVGSSADMATLVDDLDNGRAPSVGSVEGVDPVDPSGFVVDVQNGTTVEGAASSAASLLRSKGFKVGDVGNAEQPVFDETLVVYKNGDAGLANAKTVIDALGVGRAVEKSSYYTFDNDVLLIIGADNKPVA